MKDAFSKKETLLRWCQFKGVFSTADVMRYGTENYNVSADRLLRFLIEDGHVRRIPKEEAIMRNLKGKMRWYEIINKK